MGAPQNRLMEMCLGLKQLGVDVSIVTCMPNYPTGKIFNNYKGKFRCREILDGIEIIRYWVYASNSKRVIPRLLNMLSFSFCSIFSWRYLAKRKNDILIVESPPLLLGLTGKFLSKVAKSKFVMNISDLWPLSAKELGVLSENGLAYKFLERVERNLYKSADCCIGQSQQIVDYMQERKAKEVYLFRNGVDPSRFVASNITQHTSDSPLKIVYAGLLGYAQGIFGICQNINFKSLGAEFHIYGAGGEQEKIELFLGQNPDRGIFFHGKVDREEVPSILKGADCTLIPLVTNIYGAVPSKIYESMAAGLPILFSGDGEGRKIVEDNKLGWCSESLDYSALSDNIRYVSDHRDELGEIKTNCIYCAEEKFNRPKQISQLYDFLKNLL